MSNRTQDVVEILTELWNKVDIEDVTEELIDIGAIDDAAQEIQSLIDTKVKEAEIGSFDKGYDAGRKEKPARLVDAVEFRQEQYGWNDKKMAAMLDLSPPHYSEFKSGKRGLPINSIRKAYAIGIPASVLLQDDIDRQLTNKDNSDEDS